MLIRAFASRVLTAISGLALTWTVSFSSEPSVAGSFFFCINIVVVASILVRLGLDTFVIQIFSTLDSNEANSKFLTACFWVFLIALLTISALFVTGVFFSSLYPNIDWVENCLFIVLPSIFFIAISSMFGSASQGLGNFLRCGLFQNSGYSLLFVLFFYLFLSSGYKTLQTLSYSFTLATVSIFIFAFLASGIRVREVELNFYDKNLYEKTRHLFMGSLMQTASQWAPILICGFLVSEKAYAEFTVAQRVSMLLSFLLTVSNLAFASKYAKLHKEKKLRALERLCKRVSRGSILLSLPVFVLVLLLSENLMNLFGGGYDNSSSILVMLCSAQMVNLAFGPVGYLLLLGGEEKIYKEVLTANAIATIFFTFFFTMAFGVFGTAVTLTASVVLQNIILYYYVFKNLSINIL